MLLLRLPVGVTKLKLASLWLCNESVDIPPLCSLVGEMMFIEAIMFAGEVMFSGESM